nr:bifunctional diguanylate cyclase/phosphodiesterase [Sphingomicrobium sp. B8]
MYDPVTSLPNRLHFRAEADRALGMVANDQPAAMLFVDLDRFKAVNDGLGHARGDQLLTMVANRLRVVVTAEMDGENGARPLLARLAGDEFTIFFPKIRDREHIGRIARRIALAISEPFELHGHSIDIGASIGVAVVPDDGTTIEKLMRAADIAMYRAKALGGSQHVMFTPELLAEHEAKLATEHALTAALERDEFSIELQPQLDLVTGDVTGAEALLRWTHPTDGPRRPDSFIKVAEKSGLIAEIGDWVIEECAAIMERWQERGNARRMAFNISPRQLDRPDFFNRMRAAFAAHDVPLSLVELEFTETTAMQASEHHIDEIRALRDAGATVAIDDFGTGYSNIARLRTMPLDRVKLDPTLIHDIESSETAREVVQAVITLVHSVGAEVVAEAVDSEEQTDILRAMGCHTVQGYMFGRPMPRDRFFDWVGERDEANKKDRGRSVA